MTDQTVHNLQFIVQILTLMLAGGGLVGLINALAKTRNDKRITDASVFGSTVQSMQDELARMHEQMASMMGENNTLHDADNHLRAEALQMRIEMDAVRKENESLRRENELLRTEINLLREELHRRSRRPKSEADGPA